MSPFCRKCNVPMKWGKALEEVYVGSPDFIGDKGTERGCTMVPSGQSKMVGVWKCPGCGHSFRPSTKGENQ